MKILFLDLDGTIREPIEGKWVKHGNQKPIDGALEKMSEYSVFGYHMFGITNQGGVPKYKTLDDCIAEQEEALALFPLIKEILFAPCNGKYAWRIGIGFEPQEIKSRFLGVGMSDENFRKPNTGMIDYILERHPDVIQKQTFGMRANLKEHCLMVGDRAEDEQCAQNAGIDFMWAEEWRNVKQTVK